MDTSLAQLVGAEGRSTNNASRHTRLSAIRGGKSAHERQFEKLYLESYSTVYGWVRARMSSDADAEDVVSEAYLRAARSFSSFDPSRAKFGTWVITIARNCMISHFRKQRPNVTLDDIPETAFAVPGEQNASDDQMTVRALLACLDDGEREIIALKYREGVRNVDIARMLNMNPSTVSTMLSRAITKMRAQMQKMGGM